MEFSILMVILGLGFRGLGFRDYGGASFSLQSGMLSTIRMLTLSPWPKLSALRRGRGRAAQAARRAREAAGLVA